MLILEKAINNYLKSVVNLNDFITKASVPIVSRFFVSVGNTNNRQQTKCCQFEY